MQRLVVKNMLREWEQKFPGRIESIFSSICNVAASQLADPALFDFAGLDARRTVLPDGGRGRACGRTEPRDVAVANGAARAQAPNAWETL